MLETGKTLSGRYKIIRSIGSGGMANVYLGHDLILDRDVAVKVLRFDFQEDQSAIRRFQREALASTELVHPNIVTVYDVGEEDGMQFLVMEYVKGTDLKKYIINNFPLPYGTVIDIMDQILSGMSLAHEHRIIHRDLKPQNILMDEHGTVKIADFGIAIALSETSITQTNTLLGSVHYLSPEQARGGMATRQSDIYAMGVVLYELLTGNVPFEGESAVSIALKHFQNDIPSVRASDAGIPQALENVVLHATAKEPSDRYSSATEMAEDLSTSLSPDRAYEPVFKPQAMEEATKVLSPITDSMTMPQSFAEMESPAQQNSETGESEQSTDQDGKNKKKNKKKKFFMIAAIILLLIVGGAVGLAMLSKDDVNVPDVTNKTLEEATQILEDAKFEIKGTKDFPSNEIEEGKVVKTDPLAGSSVKEGGKITLYISSGNEKIQMPNVVGKNQKVGEQELIDLKFSSNNISIASEYSDEYEEGVIIEQTPKAEKSVDAANQKVTLTVSKGSKPFSLRDFSSYNKKQVEDYCDEVGLVPIFIEEYSNNTSTGYVISQSPSPNTEMKKGESITITISLGAIPQTSTSSEESSETSTTTSSSSTTTETTSSSSATSTTAEQEQ